MEIKADGMVGCFDVQQFLVFLLDNHSKNFEFNSYLTNDLSSKLAKINDLVLKIANQKYYLRVQY
jgi:hypothetical protein